MKKLLLAVLVIFGLQTQAQQSSPYFCCDSITYNIDPSQGFNISLDTTNIVHSPDSIEVWWGICTNGMCYAGDGMYDYFPQITTADTVKVGYDVYLYEANSVEVCSREEWVIFDGTSWVLFNMSGTGTSLSELEANINYELEDNRMFDILGREYKTYKDIPYGTIYIRNRNKFLKTK
jgi:hypothetical protein